MRTVFLAVLVAAGCATTPTSSPIPAPGDGSGSGSTSGSGSGSSAGDPTGGTTDPVLDPTSDYCKSRGTFCAGFGAACNTDYSPFCAGGVGLCNAGRCEHFCSSVDWPHCTSGIETDVVVGGVEVCLCVGA